MDLKIRMDQCKRRCFKAAAVLLLLGLILIIGVPGKAFASDEGSSLQRRHIWFAYSYTECTGTVWPLSKNYITYNTDFDFPKDFFVSMMLCDTDHVLKLVGDNITDDIVTFESLDTSVLEIDNSGNVTLKKSGSARIKATVAADNVYYECSEYIDVKVDKHDGWSESTYWGYFVDRPRASGLDLDVSEGSHQINLLLRPGANVRVYSSHPEIAYVSPDGLLTPVSAGVAYINFEIDDGGGLYKPVGFMCYAHITGDCVLRDQEITGNTGPFTIDWHEGLQLDLDAETDLEYSVIRGDDCASVDKNGFVEFTKAGEARIRVVAPPNEEFKPAQVTINIYAEEQGPEQPAMRHVWFTYGYTGSDGTVHPCSDEEVSPAGSGSTDYPSNFAVNMMLSDTDHIVQVAGDDVNGDEVSFASLNTDILEINNAGNVTVKNAGTAKIKAVVPADDTYAERIVYLTVNVTDTGDVPLADQEITGNLGPFTIDWHDVLALDLHAKTDLQYSIYGQSSGSPSVDSRGVVTFRGKGSASVKVVAEQTKEYRSAEVIIKITARDYAEEKAAKEAAAEEAAKQTALKEEIAKAKSLKRPSFKVKALKKHRNKLTWGKVANADGYIVYIKYPGTKKYVKAVTRNRTVKSVVHKGLSKGKVYRYKVRAYKKVKGKTYYGPYSKARKVRAK